MQDEFHYFTSDEIETLTIEAGDEFEIGGVVSRDAWYPCASSVGMPMRFLSTRAGDIRRPLANYNPQQQEAAA